MSLSKGIFIATDTAKEGVIDEGSVFICFIHDGFIWCGDKKPHNKEH